MNRPIEEQDTPERREQSAHAAMQGYRERRRRRRGEDTYFGSSECLLPSAEAGLSRPELERRRVEVLEDAEAAGVPPNLAELLYDIARQEGLDPSLGLELVRCGLGVAPPEGGVSNAPSQPVTDKYLPTWMFPASSPDQLLRERMLRMSFRRLRSLLEQHEEVDQALRLFANEPDVGYFGY